MGKKREKKGFNSKKKREKEGKKGGFYSHSAIATGKPLPDAFANCQIEKGLPRGRGEGGRNLVKKKNGEAYEKKSTRPRGGVIVWKGVEGFGRRLTNSLHDYRRRYKRCPKRRKCKTRMRPRSPLRAFKEPQKWEGGGKKKGRKGWT